MIEKKSAEKRGAKTKRATVKKKATKKKPVKKLKDGLPEKVSRKSPLAGGKVFNKMGERRKAPPQGGRPSFFVATPESKEELVYRIDDYFAHCQEDDKPPTVTGLALALGMSRQVFCNYKKREEFVDIINAARQVVEAEYEHRMINGQASTGVIFASKVNFGWRDGDKDDKKEPVTVIVQNYAKQENEGGASTHADQGS